MFKCYKCKNEFPTSSLESYSTKNEYGGYRTKFYCKDCNSVSLDTDSVADRMTCP